MSRYSFQVGQTYKRSQIKQAIGLDPNAKGGPWDTGYAEKEGADFIFCNVGTAGRTGHDYDNYFDGSELVWRGKTNCEFPAYRSHFVSGVMAPSDFRHKGATPFPA